MIGFLPDPYPDELVYSLCARFQERVQYTSSESTIHELFGTAASSVNVALPSSLGKLISSLPTGHHYTVDRLIDEHSLLPFCTPFLNRDRVNHLREDMCGDTKEGVRRLSLFTALSMHLPEFFRFCSLCVQKDKKQFGECYWYRLHQLPGVEVCPIHNVFLDKSKARARSRRLIYDLVSAEQAVEVVPPRSLDLSNPCHEFLLKIACDATWLLSQPGLFVGLESIRSRYFYLLERSGLANYAGQVRVQELLEAFRNYYPSELLKLIHCEVNEQKQHNWLFRLMRQSNQWGNYPLHHLLVIHFLGHTVEEFFALPERFSHFGDGPWPCLNRASKHFRQPVIEEYQITRNQDKGKLTATFSCTCGFAYSRTGPDKSPEERFRFNRVKSYGSVWEASLKELWIDSTLPFQELAARLGIDKEAVKRQAVRLGLTFPRPGPTLRVTQENDTLSYNPLKSQTLQLEKLEKYRSEWLSIRREFPNAGRTFLQNRFRRIHGWLYNNDKEWLMANLPSRKPKKISSSCVDWESRDTQLAEAVRLSALRLKNVSGCPVRITKTEIAHELGQPNLAKQPLNKLPLTTQALAEVIESLEEFAIRRIRWATDCYLQEKVYPKHWQLNNRAGLSANTAALPQVKKALDAAFKALDSLSTVGNAELPASHEVQRTIYPE